MHLFSKTVYQNQMFITIGAQEEGALATYLAGSELQLGEKESIEDIQPVYWEECLMVSNTVALTILM